ncbi:MAG TPA: hypothetical protein VFO39_07270 [Candidatus Sulfotelmatobacter sp.]|nr:hypothetical protein [Candidatus Sulfotelmatobacter sp.]
MTRPQSCPRQDRRPSKNIRAGYTTLDSKHPPHLLTSCHPMNGTNPRIRPGVLFRTIMRDIHFWIPLVVLLAGLLFLHQLH